MSTTFDIVVVSLLTILCEKQSIFLDFLSSALEIQQKFIGRSPVLDYTQTGTIFSG